MKTINKIRISQPCFFISMGMLLLVLGVSWFFESYFAEVMFFMDYNAPDLVGIADAKSILLKSVLTWERFIDASMRYVVNIFPLFAVLPVIPFCFERKIYFIFGAARFHNYGRELYCAILKYSIWGGICISVGFSIYFSAASLFMVPSVNDIGGFSSIFPTDFYSNHPYLFFLFLSVSIYFAVGVVFSGMACAIALYTDKEFYMLTLPILVYIGDSYLGYTIDFLPFKISESVCAFNTLYTTGQIFIPLLPLAIIDILLIVFGVRNRRKAVDL